jgi:hypothetical protein
MQDLETACDLSEYLLKLCPVAGGREPAALLRLSERRHQESGSCVGQAAALDREHLNRRGAPAQLRWP